MIYFISDEHFGHDNIIKYCNRPFSSTEEMNEELIKRHNSIIKPNDTVYHLGDFAFGDGSSNPGKFFNRLNGKKILVKGNHDAKPTLNLSWDSIHDLHETYYKGVKIVMCHYAMRTWNKSHAGAYQLYGHSHNAFKEDANLSFDVGVDGWNYSPISVEQVVERMIWKTKNVDYFSSEEYNNATLTKDSTRSEIQRINAQFY